MTQTQGTASQGPTSQDTETQANVTDEERLDVIERYVSLFGDVAPSEIPDPHEDEGTQP